MPNLLIVDDDRGTSSALASLLRLHGHDVACAGTVAEALTELRRGKPDLMLLDLGLGRVDGLSFLHAIAEEQAFDAVPVAVYSGRDEPDAVAAAKRLGACDYIVKGLAWEQTYARIQSCLTTAAEA